MTRDSSQTVDMLTQDEAELYDRQIRLWGVNAQSRIRQSKVLMLGFNGVASEVAKTLVLAGIDTLTIVDDLPLQDTDPASNLFCRPTKATNDDNENSQFRTHAVKAKLKELNPLVKVNIDNSSILSKGREDFKQYDLVTLHSFLTIEQTSAINNDCRLSKVKFYIVVDFGFFGLMFNDLGSEFQFTYEEFNNLSAEKEGVRQSGEEKDPISLDEDKVDDDIGCTTSDDERASEASRPKKKRRLHSPKKEPVTKTENDNEKQTKIGTLQYVTFQDMISLKTTTFTKQTSPVLLISIAMFKFYSKYKYLPRCENIQVRQEDISILNEIIVSLRDSLDLHESVFKKLDKDWSENIYDNLSPICAVVGGVAGQDIIRALSNKDIPICNTFAFDGLSMNGIVEKVGIPISSSLTAQPIVRDFLSIDDDEN